MPFGKRFRFGGNAPTAIGIGDGEANLDELAGQKHKDFSHLSGGSGKVELSSSEAAPGPVQETPTMKEAEMGSPGEVRSVPTDDSSSPPERHLYRLETAEELETRDPEEIISVPMIFTVQKMGLKRMLGKREHERKITFRKMPRGHYRAHYAKDANGNYIGIGKPASDAGMVYVYSSTAQDIDDQLKKVAFGREHHPLSYPIGDSNIVGGSGA